MHNEKKTTWTKGLRTCEGNGRNFAGSGAHGSSRFPRPALAFWLIGAFAAMPSIQAQTFRVLHYFAGSPDGSTPSGNLVKDAQGNLYGTTKLGGAYGFGSVFMIRRTGVETVLYSFTGPSGDGEYPLGGVVRDSAGNLYGTTEFGGANSCKAYLNVSTCGTVFKLDNTGKETVLHSFTGGDGQNPTDTLLLAHGRLYGTVLNGGANTCSNAGYVNCGTVFEMTLTGQIVHEYQLGNGTDGGNPYGGVIQDQEGNLYGTTINGGVNRHGTVFEISKGFTQETVLYNFGGADGSACPDSTLVRDSAGELYGTADGCYGYCDIGTGCGIVFKLDSTGTETTLYRFAGGSDGSYPVGGVVRDASGNLFGTTTLSGAYGGGTIYEILTAGGEKTLYDLNPKPDGSAPFAALTLGNHDTLYGTASSGGTGCSSNACGTVFKLVP